MNIPASIQAFTWLGVSEQAAACYLALLDLKQANATNIAKQARLHRTFVYKHLTELKERGLVFESIRRGRRFYEPAHPQVIEAMVEERVHDISSSVLPMLMSAFSKGEYEQPKFRIYADIDGVKRVLEEVLENPTRFYRIIGAYYDQAFQAALGQGFWERWTERRIKNGCAHESLRPYSMKEIDLKEQNFAVIARGKEYLRDYRYIDIAMPILIYAYDNKLAFISARIGSAYAAVLESKDACTAFNSIFELLWRTASENG